MPRFQLHIVRADNNENVRQPIVEVAELEEGVLEQGLTPEALVPARQVAHEGRIRESFTLKPGEAIAAVTEVNEAALAKDYPDGHPFEVSL